MYWLYLAWKEKVWTWYVHLFFSKSSSIYVASQETDTFCAEMSWQPKDADWKLPQCEVEQANLPKIACLYHTYFRFTVSYKHVQTRKNIITNISCFLAMPMSTSCPPASEVMDEVLNFTAFRIPGALNHSDGWMDHKRDEVTRSCSRSDGMMTWCISLLDFMYIYIYIYMVFICIYHMYMCIISIFI